MAATAAAGATNRSQLRCATQQRLAVTPPRRLLSPSPIASATHLDLVIIGLSLAPPGFSNTNSLVQPPSRLSDGATAARAAAIFRLASAAAACVLQQQLGLASALPLIKRVWLTPGGRWAAFIRLPTSVAAQALARKRHHLRGTSISVDLLRDQLELAVLKMRRVQQLQQQGPVGEAPTAGQADVPVPTPFVLLSVGPFWLLPTFALVAIGILMLILSNVHFFPP